MTTLEDRESAFETKFAHDEERRFKVEARCTKLLGQWAAGVMGLDGDQTAAYVQNLLMADMAEAGNDDVRRKLVADLTAKGFDPASLHLDKKMTEFMEIAKTQVLAG